MNEISKKIIMDEIKGLMNGISAIVGSSVLSVPSISYTKTVILSKKQWQVANRWIPFIISLLLLRNVYYPGKQQKAVTNVTAFLVSPVLL